MQILCISLFLCQTHQGSGGCVSVVGVRARTANVHQRKATWGAGEKTKPSQVQRWQTGKKSCNSESSREYGKMSTALSVKWQPLNCVGILPPERWNMYRQLFFSCTAAAGNSSNFGFAKKTATHTHKLAVSILIQPSSDMSSKDLNVFHNYQCFNRITWGTEVFLLRFCILRKPKHWWLKQGHTECQLQSWQWHPHPFTFSWCFTQQFKSTELQEDFAKTWR